MSLHQLQQQIDQLSLEEKIILMNNLALSLKDENKTKTTKQDAIKKMKGFLKANTEAPSDIEIENILKYRKENKYL